MLTGLAVQAQNNRADIRSDSVIVFIFLLEDCTICRNYSQTLSDLHSRYAIGRMKFTGLFPNRYSRKKAIKDYKRKYHIPFELKKDTRQKWTRKLGAKITPEAVVYNQTKDLVVYRGRIDNSYASLGVRRAASTTSELEDALEAILENKEIILKETEAIGCFITHYKSIPPIKQTQTHNQ